MNTEERLDRLEQQNRNLRRGLVGLLLLLLVLVALLVDLAWRSSYPATAEFETVRTQTLHVTSPNEKHSMNVFANDTGVLLAIFDHERNDAVIVKTDSTGPSLTLDSRTGSVRLHAGQLGASVSVRDRQGLRAWLLLSQDNVSLRLKDTQGTDRAVMEFSSRDGKAPRKPMLTLFDDKGNVITECPSSSQDSSHIPPAP